MVITKKSLSRRTMLRGLGASIALPLLDGMVPAFAAIRNTAARPVKRLGAIYVPNGMSMARWLPPTEGALEMSPVLSPADPGEGPVAGAERHGQQGGQAAAGRGGRRPLAVPGGVI